MNSRRWGIVACWALMSCVALWARSSRHDHASAVAMALGRWGGGRIFDAGGGHAWLYIGVAGVALAAVVAAVAVTPGREMNGPLQGRVNPITSS
jgi:predicted MFS family arabinose efflux permease